MRNINKAIAIICLTAIMICIGYRIKVRADDIPTGPHVLQMYGVGDMTGIAYAYDSLTSDQKDIAAYLIGAYNNVYLMARGFSYSIPENENSWKAQFLALGRKVWQFATTAYGWKSRFNETFRQYMSSVCVYASGISTSFEAWYQQNSDDDELFIPYSEDSLSAWTEFYNDPSGNGISSFGYQVTEWNSGEYYDFAFANMPWYTTADQERYNTFILNFNPVLFTNTGVTNSNTITRQFMVSPRSYPNTLFVKRSSAAYTDYRYGFDDFTFPAVTLDNLLINFYQGSIRTNNYSNGSYTFNLDIQTATATTILNDFINEAFANTPFEYELYYDVVFKPANWYPFIEHVYLVDDLTTLSNPEEVYDVTGLNIVAPDPSHEPYIIAPNGRLLFPTRPIGYDDPLNFWDNIVDNSVDDDGNSVSDDDFHNQIINTTTINNYYVTNDDRINVPVEWFENDLTDQLANDSIPFLTFARDCIDTLGDLQIYLYGAIVFGLGSGILKKFLL